VVDGYEDIPSRYGRDQDGLHRERTLGSPKRLDGTNLPAARHAPLRQHPDRHHFLLGQPAAHPDPPCRDLARRRLRRCANLGVALALSYRALRQPRGNVASLLRISRHNLRFPTTQQRSPGGTLLQPIPLPLQWESPVNPVWKAYAAILAGLFALAVGMPRPTQALPVEYRISGLLTGDLGSIFNPVSLVDVPFEITIAADTETAFEFGHIPGVGSAFVNDSEVATWTVDRLGTATSDSVQLYSLPGVARVGFGWNGEVLPLNTNQPAERIFEFSSSAFALELSYGGLNAVVPAIPLSLRTDLRNPPGTLPFYSTSIHFPDQGPLTLKELRSLSYSVVAIPEPSTVLLLASGLAALAVGRRHSSTR